MSEDKQHKQVDGPPVEMSRYDEDADLEDCVSEVIVTVLDQLDFDISAKRMRLMENGLVAEVAMYKLQELVHLATVQHDGDWLPGQMLEVLVPDEEPVPAPVDNWARGSGKKRRVTFRVFGLLCILILYSSSSSSSVVVMRLSLLIALFSSRASCQGERGSIQRSSPQLE